MSAPMEETLSRFREQFSWRPEVENALKLGSYHHFIVAGMGGSHLGAWLIKKHNPELDIIIHRNYGLPPIQEGNLRNTLFIASSFSGTTEETLDAAQAAVDRGMHVAAIATGGKLLEFAREKGLPFVTIPDSGLEPRMAIGYAMKGIAKLLGDPNLESAIREGGLSVEPVRGQAQGMAIAEKLIDKIPVIWSSSANAPLGFIWKIKFNETSKIPAFCNVMPELCHNEFTGFDVVDSTRAVSSKLHIIMLEDDKDHPRIQKRMRIAREMLEARGIPVERVTLEGEGFAKVFSAALLGDWVSLGLARHYKVPNPETPLIAEFKKKMAQE
jgi:glucose/mannose-6-phosphate isomerase